MICTECGFMNDENRENCEKCKHPLPHLKSPPHLTTRLVKIYTAVKDLARGQITSGEFEAFMNETRDFLIQQYEEVRSIEIPLDMTGEVKKELETGLLGIETFISSIDLFKQYLSNRSASLLDEGMKTARKANDLVNAALAMNWENYDVFRESTEEFLRYTQPDYN